MKPLKYQTIYFYLIPLTLVLACSEIPEQESLPGNQPRFHTAASEGIWEDMGPAHLPQIAHVADKPGTIEVSIPLTPTTKPRHYIEAIVLMQGTREIAVRRPNPAAGPPSVEFQLPDPYARNYTVVVKCSIHDMWRAEVPPRPWWYGR